MFLDSFSGEAAELPANRRTPEDVFEALRRNPRVSCFDLSELAWLRNAIQRLEQQGRIVDDKVEPYPWIRYAISDEGSTS